MFSLGLSIGLNCSIRSCIASNIALIVLSVTFTIGFLICSVAILVDLLPLRSIVVDYGLWIRCSLLVFGVLNECGSACSKHGSSRRALRFAVGLLRLRYLHVVLVEELLWDCLVHKAGGFAPYVLAAELADH